MQKQVESYSHNESKRKIIPTEQLQSFVPDETQQPVTVEYQRRNPDLDPQLIWKGKYDGGDVLSIGAKPLYIQEKIHPKAIIENLRKTSMESTDAPSLFEDTFGMPPEVDRMDFYKHDQNWTNRMILGDSLQVMASLANREGLRGKVQTIYIDPPYGIKFNSNFQWSTKTREVKDGKNESMTREPEQVKAYRDTWKHGVHSYLTYLRDRLLVAQDLLSESGSIFVQISDAQVHRVRCLLDEIFGEQNYMAQIKYVTSSGFTSAHLSRSGDNILWYAKDSSQVKFNQLYKQRTDLINDPVYKYVEESDGTVRQITPKERANPENLKVFCWGDATSQNPSTTPQEFEFEGKIYIPPKGRMWTSGPDGLRRLNLSGRIKSTTNSLRLKRYANDNSLIKFTDVWDDTGTGSFTDDKIYVVQTGTKVITRCLLMTTDPGDLVLDPTCGSGTTAYVSEMWGRRWITIDTSRVSLALARARLMGAKYPYFLLKDSEKGRRKEFELYGSRVENIKCRNNIRYGFVYTRSPKLSIKSIATNKEIDVIEDKYKPSISHLLAQATSITEQEITEWNYKNKLTQAADRDLISIKAEIDSLIANRKKEIDASNNRNVEFELLLDSPIIEKDTLRVSGPFTVESLSPHRILGFDADGKTIDPMAKDHNDDAKDFVQMIIGNLRSAGIQQSDKSGKLDFNSVEEFPGDYLCAEGRYMEGDQERRAGILIGPEFGTLTKADIMAAAREAVDCGFTLLVACAFHFDAQSSDVTKLGRLPIMKVMMNTDLMMGEALKGKGNLFVAFGEPDIVVENAENDQLSGFF